MIAHVFRGAATLESVTKASGGLANTGIYFYTVRRAFGVRRFIEKRTTNEREIRIVRVLAERSRLRPSVMPRVYRVAPGRGHTSILMEHIEGVGHIPPRTERTAMAIARALVKLQRTCAGAEIEHVPSGILRVVRALKGSELDPARVELITRALEKHYTRFSAGRRVMCHADVIWPNLSLRAFASVPYCRLIDFGYMGWNAVGSDLHHFYKESVWTPSTSDFYAHLVRLLAAGFDEDEESIDFAAVYYSVLRSAFMIRRLLDSGETGRARRQAEFCTRLITRLD